LFCERQTMTTNKVTIEDVLRCWRRSICFADGVKLKDGRYATVIAGGAIAPLMLTVIVGAATAVKDSTKESVHRDDLFPAWWPEAQFDKVESSESTKKL
jgi:hypothetical protein